MAVDGGKETDSGESQRQGLGLVISKKEESRMNVKFPVYVVLRAITIVLDAGTVI